MAAMRTVEELLELAPQAYDITVFGAEPHGNYNRMLLSPLLAGDKRIEEIITHPPEWYARARHHAASGAIPSCTSTACAAACDRATGVEAPLRPAADRHRLGAGRAARPRQRLARRHHVSRSAGRRCHAGRAPRATACAVVIGGGLLGLEAANGLLRRGMDVTVVHLLRHLMERQLDAQAARAAAR